MRKPRIVARDVDRVASRQGETTALLRVVASILTRGFLGRLKWLVCGR